MKRWIKYEGEVKLRAVTEKRDEDMGRVLDLKMKDSVSVTKNMNLSEERPTSLHIKHLVIDIWLLNTTCAINCC